MGQKVAKFFNEVWANYCEYCNMRYNHELR